MVIPNNQAAVRKPAQTHTYYNTDRTQGRKMHSSIGLHGWDASAMDVTLPKLRPCYELNVPPLAPSTAAATRQPPSKAISE